MKFENIKAKDINEYINNKEVLIIDLREKEQYDNGHIPSAINIPIEDFDINSIILKKYKAFVLYCERGNVSILLSRDLSNAGYEVKNLYGGLNFYRGTLVR